MEWAVGKVAGDRDKHLRGILNMSIQATVKTFFLFFFFHSTWNKKPLESFCRGEL